MDKKKTLDDYASVNNDKNNSFRFVADFKNILVLRLLGGSKFKLVPKTKEMKLIQHIRDSITDDDMKHIEKAKEYHNIDKDATLQITYNHFLT